MIIIKFYGQDGDGDAKEKSINFSTLGKNGKVSYKVYGSLVKGSPFTVDTPYKQQAVNPSNHQPVSHTVNSVIGKQAVTYVDNSTVKTVGFGLGYEINEKLYQRNWDTTKESMTFEEKKSKILNRITKRLSKINRRKSCVENALNNKELKACKPQRKVKKGV